jgi:polar amino acid transport system substrate-binding protein
MQLAILDEPPFCYTDESGNPAGCDVELAQLFAAAAGLEPFQVVETVFPDLLPGLAAGRWRMTTGLFVTDDRKAIVDFSVPIWALADGLLVRQGNPSKINGYASIAASPALKLAVVRGQVQHRTAIRSGVPEERILVLETYAGAADAVKSSRADAYASVARAHAAHVRSAGGGGLETVMVSAAEKAPAFGAFAFRQGDNLRRSADDFLRQFIGSAGHRKIMAKHGFSDDEIDRAVST